MDFSQLPLRDWHTPEAVGWWPPAPGWWILLILGILGLAAIVWFLRHLTRPTVKKLARKELIRLISESDVSDSERIGKLSILIRRVCVSIYPRSEAARLTGKDWLKFLDNMLDEPAFSEGPGQVLISAPYQRDVEVDQEPLFRLCERWIEALPDCSVSANASSSRPNMRNRRS